MSLDSHTITTVSSVSRVTQITNRPVAELFSRWSADIAAARRPTREITDSECDACCRRAERTLRRMAATVAGGLADVALKLLAYRDETTAGASALGDVLLRSVESDLARLAA